VFGFGFGEMMILGVVLLVVVGPRELPSLLRSVGGWVTKLRSMSRELREQSGIDDIIHDEGLKDDLQAIRSLSKGRVVDDFVRDAMKPNERRRPAARPTDASDEIAALDEPDGEAPPRHQEYPASGCDDYGAASDDAEPLLPAEPDTAQDPSAQPIEMDP
jgi:sec-independent protein translocase protein TatB